VRRDTSATFLLLCSPTYRTSAKTKTTEAPPTAMPAMAPPDIPT